MQKRSKIIFQKNMQTKRQKCKNGVSFAEFSKTKLNFRGFSKTFSLKMTFFVTLLSPISSYRRKGHTPLLSALLLLFGHLEGPPSVGLWLPSGLGSSAIISSQILICLVCLIYVHFLWLHFLPFSPKFVKKYGVT